MNDMDPFDECPRPLSFVSPSLIPCPSTLTLIRFLSPTSPFFIFGPLQFHSPFIPLHFPPFLALKTTVAFEGIIVSYSQIEMEESGQNQFGVAAWHSPNSALLNRHSHPQHWHVLSQQQNGPLIAADDHHHQQKQSAQCSATAPLPPSRPLLGHPNQRQHSQIGPTRHPNVPLQTPPYVNYAQPKYEHFPSASPLDINHPQKSEGSPFYCQRPPMMPNQHSVQQKHLQPAAAEGGWPWSASSYHPSFPHHQHPSWPVQQRHQPAEMPFTSFPSSANLLPSGALSSIVSPSSSSDTIRPNPNTIKPMQHQTFTPQQKVQHWNQFGAGQIPRDSGVHSMSHSTANSMMSSVHHPLSCISTISSLPDELSSLPDHPYFQHIPNGLRHEDPEKIREVLPELIPLINDDCEEVVLRALNIINGIAKKDKNRAAVETPLISEQKVVEGLLKTMKKHRRNKRVISYALRTLHFISNNEHSGRDLFARTIDAHGTSCLEELVHSIGVPEHSCFKYAFLILHNLISDHRLERRVIAYLCEMQTLTEMLGWLEDKNEKFLNIVTDIMQKLITKSTEQMAFFIELNGHQKLILLIANCRQETLLWRATKLMDKIVQQQDAERMVEAGLLEALQCHLEQSSQRLLRQVLCCLRSVSHVHTANRPIQPLLNKLLQLLGTSDLRLKESCVDILTNLSANNSKNKTFLVENGAVPSMFQLLYELDSVRNGIGEQSMVDDSFQRQLESIQETALTLLKSLCSGSDDDERLALAKRQILHDDAHKRTLLQKLREWHFGLLRRALLLLLQLANCDVSLLSQLRFFVSFGSRFAHCPTVESLPVEHCSFVSQIALLLDQFIEMLPNSIEFCRHCLDILRALCRDRLLLEEIYCEFRTPRDAASAEGQCPRVLIHQLALCCSSDQLAPNAICLLSELARIPETLQIIRQHANTMEMLRRWGSKEADQRITNSWQQHQRVREAAQKASQLLQQMELGGAIQDNGRGRSLGPNSELAEAGPMTVREQLSSMAIQNDFSPMDCSSAAAPAVPWGDDGPSRPIFLQQSDSSHSDCSRQQTHMDHSALLRNKEQLTHEGAFEEIPQDLTFSGHDFSDEFGLFVNAFCPNSSPNWTPNCHKQ